MQRMSDVEGKGQYLYGETTFNIIIEDDEDDDDTKRMSDLLYMKNGS